MKFKLLVLVFALMFSSALSQEISENIMIDGKFSDWVDFPSVYVDKKGDGDEGGVDFRTLKMTDDDKYIYFYIETGKELSIQNSEGLKIYIDADNDYTTGEEKNRLGSELIWNFEEKKGRFVGSSTTGIKHPDLDLYIAPTVTSDRFEFLISKSIKHLGKPVFINKTIGVALKNSSDRIPDKNDVIEYKFKNNARNYDKVELNEPAGTDIRLMSYNVLFDNPFKDELYEPFSRIINAVDADIIGFQEIYDHSAQETLEFVSEITNEEWFTAKAEPDLVVLSKFSIIDVFEIDGSGAFLIDLPETLGEEFLLINAHLKCCNNDHIRRKQVNKIMKYISVLKNRNKLRPFTPIFIAGDMNFVGDYRQVLTLLEGQLEEKTDERVEPDWNSTAFTDIYAPVPNMPVKFTWNDPESNYSPGRLDYVIYSDDVADILNKFVLFTPTIKEDELREHNLFTDDAVQVSDHFPVVVDIKLK